MAQTLPIASEPLKPQSMILTRTHEEDQLANTRMMDEFEFAFIVEDIRYIRKLLHEKGWFFGKHSKFKALALFIDLFKSAYSPCKKNNLHINKGFNPFEESEEELVEKPQKGKKGKDKKNKKIAEKTIYASYEEFAHLLEQ